MHGQKWFKELNVCFHKSFKKVRISNRKKDCKKEEIDDHFDVRRKLVMKLKESDDKENVENELLETEKAIGKEIYEKNREKVIENFKNLEDSEGLVNTNGMWNLKKKVFPKNKESLPCAKKNSSGNLVTKPAQLRSLYIDTFAHRMRKRPIVSNLESLKILKENLCEERLRLCKRTKTHEWSHGNLNKVLRELKLNKSRDPHGLINEIFKPGVIGHDLEHSILILMNKVKDKIAIPKFMEYANIVAIYKGRGDKSSLENDRGIFLVNVLRNILMKLVYNDNYDIVDNSMSDSQVGARRNKNIRNHIFLLNGMINEAIQTK